MVVEALGNCPVCPFLNLALMLTTAMPCMLLNGAGGRDWELIGAS